MTTLSKGSISSSKGRGNSTESAEGIIDIRNTHAAGPSVHLGTIKSSRKKTPGYSNQIVFDERQMMTVKVMRSTLEKPSVNRKKESKVTS
jgi:hypothetical protein